MDLARRSFLGGLISLVAVKQFDVTKAFASNLPRIYADKKNDDSHGLGALFRNEPCIFSKDDIGIESHNGIIIHGGSYVIGNTIHIPNNLNLQIERAFFNGTSLFENSPFFIAERITWKSNPNIIYFHNKNICKLVEETIYKASPLDEDLVW
jgi:hypothetical protein